MQTSIYSELELKKTSFDCSTYQVKEKVNNSKFSLDTKFYQKLFVLLLALCSFLIIPESPKDSEILCKKYYSIKACNVW